MLKNFVRADWFLGEKRLSIYKKKHLVKQQQLFLLHVDMNLSTYNT